jgi:type VI secretion system protein ImpA
MSELDDIAVRIQGWLEALPDEAAPCGVDLEYDNDFLAITKAAAGKPESQFGAAEPPDWRAVAELAEGMFERTRDLRLAILWLRANLHLHGYGALPIGLTLLTGLMEGQWDHLHPLPDPDDGDMYARVNAITLLRDPEGVIGDLRAARIVQDRAIGELTVRAVELALGLSPPREGESEMGKDPVSLMLRAALEKTPALRAQCQDALALTRRLMSLVGDKFNRDDAPDLRPLYSLVNGIASLLPSEAAAEEAGADDGGADDGGGSEGAGSGRPSAARRGLSGSVSSREEAVRAIDMVCEYLMQAEPSNPASLFLRRGRQLINHDFLQLMKALAPDALSEVARVVGVDPESVESPEGP